MGGFFIKEYQKNLKLKNIDMFIKENPMLLDPELQSDSTFLDLRSYHSQVTCVGCSFPAPSFLSLEEDVKPKLLIIIIIIIIIIINFTLQIKSMFFRLY